jgi:eukaryotic-like serine/threonine-protein kinase
VAPSEREGGPLPGSDRFVLVRRLGSGSVGVVYEAFDRERAGRVALKTLHHLDADGIYHLKREFRALSDVVHPNLIQLHELHSVDERWFFTMELVEGTDFLSYVQQGAAPGPQQEARLRPALLQLSLGVEALHAAGKLHRDIKPSNALVSREGRVVLLDFGLVTDVTAGRLYQTLEPDLVGTPAYLAPEQAAGQALSPACDWYSVGALLYQALTGVLPFSGGLFQVLSDKQRRDPPAPSTIRADVDPDLEALCLALLQRRPEDRPDDREVLRRLGGPDTLARRTAHLAGGAGAPWVGRVQQLATLRRALATVDSGRRVVVFAHGESGMGKTTLVQRFLDEIGRRPRVVVLSGRCYERELVPYRALDSLIDGLVRYLMTLPLQEAEGLLPRDIQEVARLFPVLRRIEILAGGGQRAVGDGEPADPPELRRRAFSALRDLLARIAGRKTLVLHIDDLQWGDADSATLLRHLLAPPAAPTVLAIFSYRSEDAGSACVAALEDAGADGPLGGTETMRLELPIGPLDSGDAAQLARALLAEAGLALAETDHAGTGSVETVVAEAAGNPFFIGELVEYLRSNKGHAAGITLDEVLRARIFGLGDRAHRALEALALAARPLPRDLVNRAAGLDAGEEQPLNLLRSTHLVRTRGTTHQGQMEVSHDRIRVAVVAAMPAERLRSTHLALARALGSAGDMDPELVAVHFEGAGEHALAGREAARAAERADQALAFDRASRLYRWALTLARVDDPESASLAARLGDALANLGRGPEAAEAYLAAARGASAAGALELRRRAAEQLLHAGDLDRGLAALREVLSSFHIALAPTPRRALLSLAGRRALIRLRGLRFHERDTSQIAPQELVRLDVFWSVSTALSIIDNVRATDFQARNLLLALRLGEPYRIARALCTEVVFSALRGNRARRRTATLVKEAEAVATRVDRPFARGWATLSAGIAAYLEGRHQPASQLCERAEAIFQGCTGVWWEVGSGRLFSLWSRFYLGQLVELGRRLPAYIEEALSRGDHYSATNLRGGILSWYWLVADQPDRADEEIDSAMRRWSAVGFHSQHFWQMLTNASAHLYRGDPARALARVDGQWPSLVRSLLLRVQIARIECFDLRGRCALALAATAAGNERRRLEDRVAGDIRRLQREGTPAAVAQAQTLAAGLVERDAGAACRRLRAALAGFEAAGMALHASVVRRRLGERCGGEEGKGLVHEADLWFATQGVKNPTRVTATLAPGF